MTQREAQTIDQNQTLQAQAAPEVMIRGRGWRHLRQMITSLRIFNMSRELSNQLNRYNMIPTHKYLYFHGI